MKQLYVLFLFTVIAINLSAQKSPSYIKKPSLGVHFIFQDFKSASYVKANSFSQALRDQKLGKINEMNAGLGLSYLQGLSNHLDLSVGLSGAFLDYPIPNISAFGSENLLLEADFSCHAKMFSDNYWVSPYLSAGLGASTYKGYYGAFLPLGAGLQVNFFNEAFLLIGTQYRVPITDNTNYHFFHSVGVAGNLGKKKEGVALPPPTPPVVQAAKDSDGDGIVDSLDKCPDSVGLARLEGCPVPDTDKDGINDEEDKCKDTAGVARYQGCPVPDTDGDGVNDEEDKCKDTAGIARLQGCPIPDTDKDGVNDEEDKCPEVPGTVASAGCPEVKAEVIKKVEYAAKNILFPTANFKLLPKSFKSLNEVAKVLVADTSLKLDIDGHTDSLGTAEKNLLLSQNRAEAVKKYLVSKGVEASRLTATGYGSDKSIANNKTFAGRARNRRVALTLKYF
jgi:OmpA-OmpF porin, OOP family